MDALDDTQLVSFLEAVYALELDDRSWLDGILSALRALCGDDHSYVGFFYDASDVADLKIWNVAVQNTPPESMEAFQVFREISKNPTFVRTTFRSLPVGSARRTAMPYLAPVFAVREKHGWGDIFNINGIDPSGVGCDVTIGTRARECVPSASDVLVYKRLANHLAAAFRLRRRLGVAQVDGAIDLKPVQRIDDAEAILDERGKFVHATGAAAGKLAQERIKSSMSAIDAQRNETTRNAGRSALDHWHPLTGARWTLVDSFQENGRRYLVARENQAHGGGFDALTDRERQIVLHAALGFSNKEIAYTLGISDTTVRVLIARAAGRLGLKSRRQLLLHPALQELQPDSSESNR
ncbi:MAG TPA: LuxR C-terminal-related transcriptional regulator [Polyangiaceae bacterium]|nr:LuxR C-terminal-related transcriptional regulator [Polyangiaceae bacterium]